MRNPVSSEDKAFAELEVLRVESSREVYQRLDLNGNMSEYIPGPIKQYLIVRLKGTEALERIEVSNDLLLALLKKAE